MKFHGALRVMGILIVAVVLFGLLAGCPTEALDDTYEPGSVALTGITVNGDALQFSSDTETYIYELASDEPNAVIGVVPANAAVSSFPKDRTLTLAQTQGATTQIILTALATGKSYAVTISRAEEGGGTVNNYAALTSLAPTRGNLSPSFEKGLRDSSGIINYETWLMTGDTELVLKATAGSGVSATFTVDGDTVPADVDNGTYTLTVPYDSGITQSLTKVIEITVQQEGKDDQVYRIEAWRPAQSSLPGKPTKPDLDVTVPGELTVQWTGVERAEWYEVWYGRSRTLADAVRYEPVKSAADAPALEYQQTLQNMVQGVQYSVWVRAGNSEGTGEYSNYTSIITPLSSPVFDTIISGTRRLTLQWFTVNNAAGYDIKYRTGEDTYTLLQTVSYQETSGKISYVLNNLGNNTPYQILVMAKNDLTESPWSDIQEAYTVPSAPAAPVVNSTAPGNLTVTWTDDGTDVHEVRYSQSSDPEAAQSLEFPGTDTSTTLTDLVKGVRYYVWLRAQTDAAGYSSLSPYTTGITMLSAPVQGTPSGGQGQITIGWEPVVNAGSYEVRYSTDTTSPDGGTSAQLVTVPAPEGTQTITYTLIGLSASTEYRMWVRALNQVPAQSSWSAFTQVRTALAPIGAPPAPLVSSTAPGTLTVSWDDADADTYEIRYSKNADSETATVQELPGTDSSATLIALDAGVRYYVWLRSKKDILSSPLSSAASGITMLFSPVMGDPERGQGQIRLSWAQVANAGSYEVRYSTSLSEDGSPTAQLVTVPAPGGTQNSTYDLTGLTPNTVYRIWVRALNQVQAQSLWSAYKDSRTGLATPSAPTVSSTVPGELTVSWADAGVDNYEIRYGQTSDMTAAPPGTEIAGTFTSTDLTELDRGRRYYVWIRSKTDAAGYSPYSSSGTGITLLGKPELGTISGGQEQIVVRWEPVVNAGSYEIRYSTDLFAANPDSVTNSKIISAPDGNQTITTTLTGLTANTEYRIWVRALNQVPAESPWSDPKNSRTLNNDKTLKEFTLSYTENGTPKTVSPFTESPTEYTALIPYGVTTVKIQAAPNADNAELLYLSGAEFVKLENGQEITVPGVDGGSGEHRASARVKVRAEDGTETVYTLTLNRPGMSGISVTINMKNGAIAVSPEPGSDGIILSKTGTPGSITITAEQGYSRYRWYIDTEQKKDMPGTTAGANTLTLDAADYGLDNHRVNIIVTGSNEDRISRDIVFTVQK